MDTPLTLSHAVNMAGLIQATAHWLLTERPFKHQEKDYLLYKFNRFQACRYGLEGVITDPHTGDRRPLTEDTLRLLEKIAPSAHKIGASSAIEALHRQVVSGLNEAQLMRDFGSVQSPQSAFILNLGLESLHVRMARHCENALAVARALKNDDRVAYVIYPGLEGDKSVSYTHLTLPTT